MTNEMPLDISRQRCMLSAKFLLVTLTKEALPLGISSLDVLVGVIFGNSHQTHSVGQTGPHLAQMAFDIVIHSSKRIERGTTLPRVCHSYHTQKRP